MDDDRLLGVSLALFSGLLPVADICGTPLPISPPVFATLYLHLTRPYYSPAFDWLYKKTTFLLAYALPSSAVKPAFRILSSTIGEHRQPWSPDTARALCGLLLISIFLLRTAYNLGGQLRWGRAGSAVKKGKKAQGPKLKTQ